MVSLLGVVQYCLISLSGRFVWRGKLAWRGKFQVSGVINQSGVVCWQALF